MVESASIFSTNKAVNFEFTFAEYIQFLKLYKGMVLTVNDEKDFFVPEEVFDKKTFKRGNVR